MLPKSNRILRSSEFRQIYDSGTRMTSRYFSVFCLSHTDVSAPSQFGFTLPRALGKAVRRNRIKRRFREAVRRNLNLLPENWKVVFNPKRSSLDATFEELCREISRVFTRCSQS